MWSLGCLAAALLVGNLLYCGKSDYDIVRASCVQGFCLHRFPSLIFFVLFSDAADRPDAGLPLKAAAVCRPHDRTVL